MSLTLHLAHGASGTSASMRPHVEGLARRGVRAVAVDLPRGSAERALPVYRSLVTDPAHAVIGGHSFGGRVASMLAAELPVRGVVLLSYPLHRPGRPLEVRSAHWPQISCPVLLLTGGSDPFATAAVLDRERRRIRSLELHIYPGVAHGLLPVLDDALDRVAAFVQGL
ncbi:MAG: alpha/beta fold hydrolase [Candidatus Dormibacteria bacterium]